MNEANEAGHTLGPWYSHQNRVWGDRHLFEGTNAIEYTYKIADCTNHMFDKFGKELKGYKAQQKHVFANAALIAAAPDLLAVLEHVLAMHDDAYLCGHPEWHEIVTEARAAVSKARAT